MGWMNKFKKVLAKRQGLPIIKSLEQIRDKKVVPVDKLATRFSEQNRDVCLVTGGLCKTFVRKKDGAKVSIARIMSNKEVMDVICRRFNAKELFNGTRIVDSKVLTTSTVIQLLVSTGANIEEAIGPEGHCFLLNYQCVPNCSRIVMLVVKGILLARREKMMGDTLRISGDSLRKIRGKIIEEGTGTKKNGEVYIHPEISGRISIIQKKMKPSEDSQRPSVKDKKFKQRISDNNIRQLMLKKGLPRKIGSAARVQIGGKGRPEIFKAVDDVDRLDIAEKIPGFYEWNISDSAKIQIIEKILNKETTIERVAKLVRKDLERQH